METNAEKPGPEKQSDLDEEIALLWEETREAAKAAAGQARRIVRNHPGWVAGAALLTGIWIGTKLRP